MAGKFSIYKYVKLEGKGWRYARAAYHPNGKIKPNVVLVKGQEMRARSVEPPTHPRQPVSTCYPIVFVVD